jgi:glycosyltransferase involved in cell wall biosynthesis
MPQQNILNFETPAFVAAENNLPAHTRMAELIREKRIAEINPDVLHIASLFEGAGEDVVTSVGWLFPAERTAVTLYDLIPFLDQKTYLTNQMLAGHYFGKLDGLKKAGMLLSISEFSRTEAVQHAGIPADRITNISSAVDGQFAPQNLDAASKYALLHKSGIDRPFLLFTGSFDTRKNHDRLVKAFAKLNVALRKQYQLVIIGKGAASQISRLREIGLEHGLHQSDIVFVGHVSDSDLVAFYGLSTLFVFPSLREGFGLPVLEAMSCGVPTIGSNRTSIPEVIGRADALFDPEDVEDIAAKMIAVLGDDGFRTALKRHGLERARHFSWELSAQRAIEFFERTIEGLRDTRQVPAAVLEPVKSESRYESFLAAFSTLNLGKLDDEFRESAARVIAANELLTRIDGGDHHCEMNIGLVTIGEAVDRAVKHGEKVGDALRHSDEASFLRRTMDALPWRPTVFAPRTDGVVTVDGPKVVRCWRCFESDDLSELQNSLVSTALDVVVVDYAQGMFEMPALARLVTGQKELNRHVFLVLHSTSCLSALTLETGMLEVRRTLKSCDGIFVYCMDDVTNLAAFKVRKNVHFLPGSELRSLTGGAEVADYFLRKMTFAMACGGA